jgi:hypothetical protein
MSNYDRIIPTLIHELNKKNKIDSILPIKYKIELLHLKKVMKRLALKTNTPKSCHRTDRTTE